PSSSGGGRRVGPGETRRPPPEPRGRRSGGEPRGGPTMPFVAREAALETVRLAAPVIRAVEQKDRALAAQMREACISIPSNLNEGCRRRGKDRPHLWRISAGS